MSANEETSFGKAHGFERIRSVREYRESVPVRGFDEFSDDIDRMAHGSEHVLTAEPVRLFEPSSGSSGPVKLVPVTASLQHEFRRAVDVWIATLFWKWHQLMNGTAYWSVTPLALGSPETEAGIPIGFEADSAYLGRFGRLLESSVLAVPDGVKRVRDMQAFRYTSLRYLLATSDLRLVSVWNPTFLTLLLDRLPEHWDQLLADIADGRLTLPEGVHAPVEAGLSSGLRPDRDRAASLAAAGPHDLGAIWPGLTLVSCWADGPAEPEAKKLATRLPGAVLQAKGLIATEAFVSIPVPGVSGGVLATRSHFFEFVPESGGRPLMAHELEPGAAYDLLVTTGGGLYRYRLGDRVIVSEFWHDVPCLRFVSRIDRVSDWFGEKLSETFVEDVIRDVMRARGWTPTFAVLAPDDTRTPLRYTLYLELPGPPLSNDSCATLAADLDQCLCEGFHYAWCRQLGQLGAAHVVLVKDGSRRLLDGSRARGQRLGDVKPASLLTSAGWEAWLGRAAEALPTGRADVGSAP